MVEKIAFFDMDGTLLGNYDYENNEGNTSWSNLAEALGDGTLEKKREINKKWYDGDIDTYPEWVDRTLDLYKRNGLNKEIYNSIIDKPEYNNGIVEAFELLSDNDIRTVILTGGFKKSAEKIKIELDLDHFVAACEVLWNDKGEMIGNNVIPLDRSGKQKMMDMYCDVYANDEEVLTTYTGDGMNDLLAVRNADLGISYNGREELENEADVNFTDDDSFVRIAEEIIDFFENKSDKY